MRNIMRAAARHIRIVQLLLAVTATARSTTATEAPSFYPSVGNDGDFGWRAFTDKHSTNNEAPSFYPSLPEDYDAEELELRFAPYKHKRTRDIRRYLEKSPLDVVEANNNEDETYEPTSTPSTTPSSTPSSTPSLTPSQTPSSEPTKTASPTTQPSSAPSVTSFPTASPSVVASVSPTNVPTVISSMDPTSFPSVMPSDKPTSIPSVMPSINPTNVPTVVSSDEPTSIPSVTAAAGSDVPSSSPEVMASDLPSSSSNRPSSRPSLRATTTTQATAVPSVGVTSAAPSDSMDDDVVAATASPSALPTSAAPSLVPSESSSVAPSVAMTTDYPTPYPRSLTSTTLTLNNITQHMSAHSQYIFQTTTLDFLREETIKANEGTAAENSISIEAVDVQTQSVTVNEQTNLSNLYVQFVVLGYSKNVDISFDDAIMKPFLTSYGAYEGALIDSGDDFFKYLIPVANLTLVEGGAGNSKGVNSIIVDEISGDGALDTEDDEKPTGTIVIVVVATLVLILVFATIRYSRKDLKERRGVLERTRTHQSSVCDSRPPVELNSHCLADDTMNLELNNSTYDDDSEIPYGIDLSPAVLQQMYNQNQGRDNNNNKQRPPLVPSKEGSSSRRVNFSPLVETKTTDDNDSTFEPISGGFFGEDPQSQHQAGYVPRSRRKFDRSNSSNSNANNDHPKQQHHDLILEEVEETVDQVYSPVGIGTEVSRRQASPPAATLQRHDLSSSSKSQQSSIIGSSTNDDDDTANVLPHSNKRGKPCPMDLPSWPPQRKQQQQGSNNRFLKNNGDEIQKKPLIPKKRNKNNNSDDAQTTMKMNKISEEEIDAMLGSQYQNQYMNVNSPMPPGGGTAQSPAVSVNNNNNNNNNNSNATTSVMQYSRASTRTPLVNNTTTTTTNSFGMSHQQSNNNNSNNNDETPQLSSPSPHHHHSKEEEPLLLDGIPVNVPSFANTRISENTFNSHDQADIENLLDSQYNASGMIFHNKKRKNNNASDSNHHSPAAEGGGGPHTPTPAHGHTTNEIESSASEISDALFITPDNVPPNDNGNNELTQTKSDESSTLFANLATFPTLSSITDVDFVHRSPMEMMSINDLKKMNQQQRRSNVELHMTCRAPPGPLGLIIGSTPHGPVVQLIKQSSPLYHEVQVGDVIIKVDDVCTKNMSSATLTKVMAAKVYQKERRMLIVRR